MSQRERGDHARTEPRQSWRPRGLLEMAATFVAVALVVTLVIVLNVHPAPNVYSNISISPGT